MYLPIDMRVTPHHVLAMSDEEISKCAGVSPKAAAVFKELSRYMLGYIEMLDKMQDRHPSFDGTISFCMIDSGNSVDVECSFDDGRDWIADEDSGDFNRASVSGDFKQMNVIRTTRSIKRSKQ